MFTTILLKIKIKIHTNVTRQNIHHILSKGHGHNTLAVIISYDLLEQVKTCLRVQRINRKSITAQKGYKATSYRTRGI